MRKYFSGPFKDIDWKGSAGALSNKRQEVFALQASFFAEMARGVVVAAVFSLFTSYGTSIADLSSKYNHKASLDSNYILHWTHNASSGVVNIATEVKTSGWVAFGFAKEKSRDMNGYDVCVGFVSGGRPVMKVTLCLSHASTTFCARGLILSCFVTAGRGNTMCFVARNVSQESQIVLK